MAHTLDSIVSLAAAQDLWDKAWGKPWPYQTTGKVSTIEVTPGEDVPTATACGEDDDTEVDLSPTPSQLEYICLHNMQSVAEACMGRLISVEDVLVVRREYVVLRQMMEESDRLAERRSVVVTGQPGIGKTVFLLYLLLYRLERKLPTAIHLAGEHFVMFSDEGARIGAVRGEGSRLTKHYWALTDSNQDITQPCLSFQNSYARVIQTSSPRPDRWKEWIKQRRGEVVISELPHPLEIGAIMKELGLNTAQAYHLINKWGPCTRTIIDILRIPLNHRPQFEQRLTMAASAAAKAICIDPFACRLFEQPPSVWSAVLFVSPLRSHDPDTRMVTESGLAFTHIPTSYLMEILNGFRRQLRNDNARDLFALLSSHALTRPSAAWYLETRMHANLCSNSQPLTIFRGLDVQSTMQPSQQLLHGSVSALAHCRAYSTFYWFPSAANFSGIDGVLADGANIYAVGLVPRRTS